MLCSEWEKNIVKNLFIPIYPKERKGSPNVFFYLHICGLQVWLHTTNDSLPPNWNSELLLENFVISLSAFSIIWADQSALRIVKRLFTKATTNLAIGRPRKTKLIGKACQLQSHDFPTVLIPIA